MSMRVTAILLVTAAVAAAKPPKSSGFSRMDDLTPQLTNLVRQLEKAEEFERKSRWEKMIILFKRGETAFEKKKLTGEYVVTQVLKEWEDVRLPTKDVTEETLLVLQQLEDALEERFARGVEIDKKERRKAGRVLVKLLTDDLFHVRRTSIECLKKMYRNNGLLYQPDAPASDRKTKQKDWKRHVDKK